MNPTQITTTQRPIKFRAWNEEEKRMIGPYGLGDSHWPSNAADVWLIMQFTGLHDKNGTEIYEGDIFGNKALRCVIERQEDGAYIAKFLDSRIASISILDHKIANSEVIGNVHQNKDLL